MEKRDNLSNSNAPIIQVGDCPDLYWYRHRPNQAPQFILWKGARSRSNDEYIPDPRYQSRTSTTSTELTITQLTLADTALYYCALRNTVIESVEEPLHKPEDNDLPIPQRGGKWWSHHNVYQMDCGSSWFIRHCGCTCYWSTVAGLPWQPSLTSKRGIATLVHSAKPSSFTITAPTWSSSFFFFSVYIKHEHANGKTTRIFSIK